MFVYAGWNSNLKTLLHLSVVAMAAPQLVQAQQVPIPIAEVYRDCVGADLNAIGLEATFVNERLAALPAPTGMTFDEGLDAADCLQAATNEDWAYDPSRDRFGTFALHQQALLEERRALAESEATRLGREEQDRRERVIAATLAACLALYEGDEVAALTNAICNAIFMEVGLPGDRPSDRPSMP